MKIKMRAILFFGVMAIAGCGEQAKPKAEASVQWDIPPRYKGETVQTGIETARAQVPAFLDILSNPTDGMGEFRVLVKKPSGKPEYFENFVWVESVEPVEAGYVGKIQKYPEDIAKSARSGRDISFTADEIYDWSFVGPNGIYGNYVTRAELDKSGANVDNLKARFRDLSELP